MSDEARSLEEKIAGAGRGGPPPLAPFGLVLHHDGRWSHEGQPILNRKLREKFDRSVVYLTPEAKYVVQVGHFRGQIEIEEAGFFVRSMEVDRGQIVLSDGSREKLDAETLRPSSIDGALLCQVKQDLAGGGLPARFSHASQADLLAAAEVEGSDVFLVLGGRRRPLPPALVPGSRADD
ncbi:MAG: hypothetical protein NZ990_17535 [Myxococcota bacterium]|nr:hypothetical protein [Myxococcota bacterium]